jgi:hypothetical protein
MRLFKFFAAFFFTALIIFGFVFGMNWKSFSTFMDNREAMAEGSEWVEKTYSLRGLSEFIDENPQNVSIASVVIGSPDSTLFYQADTPRIMGTTANFILLLAYALEITEGGLSGDDMIKWENISRYQLPDVEESNHRNSFRTAQNRGWIENGEISLNNALSLLAEYNDVALADYLWWQLPQEYWDEFKNRLDLKSTEMPLPYSGLYLAISPGIQELAADEILDQWQLASTDEWRNHVINLSRQFSEDRDTRVEYSAYLKKYRLGNSFMEERDLMILFPKTTSREMSGLLRSLWTEQLVDQDALDSIKRWMRWPLEQQREIRQDFTDYGAIFDNRLGILNGIDFGTSSYTGDTTIQAVFFDRLPIAFWFHMSSNHMHQDFQQRLIFDPAMIQRIKQIAEGHEEVTDTAY